MTTERPSVADRSDGVTPPRHEASDIDVHGVFAFGAGLFGSAIVVFVAVWLLFMYLERREARGISTYPLAGIHDTLPPGPRLQARPQEDLEEFREREAEILRGYRWIDRDAGVVRIPIDDAMRLVLERGLPVYQPPVRDEPAEMDEVPQEP